MSKLFVRKDVGLRLQLYERDASGFDFEVVGPGRARASLAQEAAEAIPKLGVVSPISPVTLPPQAKEGAGSAPARLEQLAETSLESQSYFIFGCPLSFVVSCVPHIAGAAAAAVATHRLRVMYNAPCPQFPSML
jgi:hypothetical protein